MWTFQQQQVIDLRGKNLLVSASAGSGKTAVLVERIIKMITQDQIDIDRLLVLTFTKATAAQMRERIANAVEKALDEALKQENTAQIQHLQRQQVLIYNAQITTIDSFCLNVVRNNFNIIDLDPAFRVADETELSLIKADVIEELLEENYAQTDEEKKKKFYSFVETYSTGKKDDVIEELILELYKFSQGYPNSDKWLENAKEIFKVKNIEDFEKTPQSHFIIQYIADIIPQLCQNIDQAIKISNEADGPYMYLEALENDRIFLNRLLKADTYRQFSELLENIKWARLSPKKDDIVDIEKKEKVKELREETKKIINDKIKKDYFFKSCDEIIEDLSNSGETLDVLIELVLEFSKRYEERKLNKNVMDFNDLEHKALKILTVEDKDGVLLPSSIAEDLRDYYKEIMIDEYQDINFVQEELLKSVSKDNNRFMVGDVKQSIYKFRLARPEVFIQKQQKYLQNSQINKCITLNKNFRSRKEVLDFINFIFSQIMNKAMGEVEYDENASLKCGAEFGEFALKPEILIGDMLLDKVMEENEEEIDYTSKELEAKIVADKIKELVKHKQMILKSKIVYSTEKAAEYEKDMEKDKNEYPYEIKEGKCCIYAENPQSNEKYTYVYEQNGQEKYKYIYRNVKYGDIVILLRAMNGWAEIFEEVLSNEGIAAHCETSSGYFSTLEISVIMSLLKVIDNPMQDIPLCAVLKSPMFGFSSEELAIIRSKFKTGSFYYAVKNYANEEQAEKAIQEKIQIFEEKLAYFRECVSYISIHELIEKIVDETGYYDYISAMPAGKKRRANVDMLIEKAAEFEKTSYKGLFNFVRYIDKIREYEIDFGEVNVAENDEEAVKIMSIHKSKGLEFPVVFVSGMAKGFNKMDAYKKVVIHSELGIGCDYVNYKLRTKSQTLLKKIIAKKIILESMSEELRVLYVAMTRAKEFLILTGVFEDFNKKLDEYGKKVFRGNNEELSFNLLSNASSYFDWVIPALIRHKDFGYVQPEENLKSEYITDFEVKIFKLDEVVKDELKNQIVNKRDKQELLELIENSQSEKFKNINERLSWRYKYLDEVTLPTKLTVTELKKRSVGLDTEESAQLELKEAENKEHKTNEILPEFLSGEKELTVAQKGTITHKFMQYLDFDKILSAKDIEQKIQQLKDRKKITEYEAEFINRYEVIRFINSKLAQRMANAQKNKKLFKEQPFMVGIKANEINLEYSSDEIILVQGIIDIFFEENGELVLVDYKTDRVKHENELIQKYSAQLEYYTKALERISGKKVKEKIIYSFALNKEIRLEI